MNTASFTSHSEADTDRLGLLLAEHLPEQALVLLNGTLGAGKTRLVQSIAVACGIDAREVTSPTFVLLHEYVGKRMVFHCDAYRIRDEDEFLELGVEEYFARPGIMLIEWADRVRSVLPDEHLRIDIEVVDPNTRQFVLTSEYEEYAPVMAAIEAADR